MPATALAEPERQQQAASMEAMLQAMMTQMSSVVGAVRDIGDRVGACYVRVFDGGQRLIKLSAMPPTTPPLLVLLAAA